MRIDDRYVSESMDGKQVAPLMDADPDPDVGTLRVRTTPNFWNHSSCDHAVSTRLLPAGPDRTQTRITWLVDKHTTDGVDYKLEHLLPCWQKTSEQHLSIGESVQQSVKSSQFKLGPYSTYNEYNVEGFLRWYLQSLTAAERSST